jgi:hypothetical protein
VSVQKLWYVRHGANISGPHPAGVIGGYLLLGRLGHSDEVSLDQINWVPLEDVPELLPLNRLTDTVAADYENKKWQEERYRAALRWADERQVNERRKGASDEEPIEPKPEHPRSKTDRRRVEEGPDILALRELHIQGELQRRRKRDRYFGVAARTRRHASKRPRRWSTGATATRAAHGCAAPTSKTLIWVGPASTVRSSAAATWRMRILPGPT